MMSIERHEFADHDIVHVEPLAENNNTLNIQLDISNLIEQSGEIIQIDKEDGRAIAIHFGLIKE